MKNYVITLFAVLLLCGCTHRAATSETAPELTLPETEPTSESIMEIEPAIQPDLSISVSAGSHCRRYTDETTRRYLDYLDILENFGLIASAREIYGNEFPFIAISPCTREYSWINNPIPVTLKGLIDTIVAECEIDPDRIIITGHSRGAIDTWHMINLYGDFFSAAVPVSSRYAGKLNGDNMNSVPIRAMAGDREGCIREMQALTDRINQAGGNVEFVTIEDCKHGPASSKAFTIETFTWMLEQ